jgi:hypoxanthine phosphoribosyltransferase
LLSAGAFGHNACVAVTSLRPLLEASQIQERVAEMGRRIQQDYPERPGEPPLRLVGILKGACFFLADLARAIDRPVSMDFICVHSYGQSTVSSGEIQITKDLDHEIADLDVLVIEDIVDTGLTLTYLLDVLRQRRPRSLRVATLLDKPGCRVRPVELAYVGFEIPNEFVVGYGMDHAQLYRNLPDICVLEQS